MQSSFSTKAPNRGEWALFVRICQITCVIVAGTLAVWTFICFPSAFLCFGDCDVSKAGLWTYVDPGGDAGTDEKAVSSKMSRFRTTLDPPNDLGDIALKLLPYAPLGPACLFMAVVLATFLRSERPPFLVHLRQNPLPVVAALRSRYVGLEDHQKHSLCRSAVASMAIWAFVAGWFSLYFFTRPLPTAGVAVLVTLAAGFFLYLILYPDPASHHHREPADSTPASEGWAWRLLTPILSVPVAILCYGAAVTLVADYRNLVKVMDREPPRLHLRLHQRTIDAATGSELRGVIDALNELSPVDGGSVAPIREKTRKFLAGVQRADPKHIVAVNLCRASWFIVWTTCALFVWVFLEGRQLISMALSMLLVMSAYLAVGLAFGLIYYDYHLNEIATYNFLLDTFGSNKRAKELAARLPALTTQEKTQHESDLEALAGKLHDGQLETMIRTGFFSSSTFSQDQPQLSIEATARERGDLVFGCTFQFENGESVILPGFKLVYSRGDGGRCNQSLLTNGTCTNDVLVALGQTKSRVWSAVEEQTNADAVCRLTEFICGESAKPDRSDHHGYVVDVNAGADCTGDERNNERLADLRRREAYQMVERVQNEVAAHGKRELRAQTAVATTSPVKKWRLETRRPTMWLPSIQRRADTGCDASADTFRNLWPFTDTNRKLPNDAPNPWRAAAVNISEVRLDAANNVRMASGLSPETTLADMIYFSFVSFTTTGYGDIKAVSGPVRLGVILENILEIIFAAFFFTAAVSGKPRADG